MSSDWAIVAAGVGGAAIGGAVPAVASWWQIVAASLD